jgi:uncharacterized protein (TIGR03067 family)
MSARRWRTVAALAVLASVGALLVSLQAFADDAAKKADKKADKEKILGTWEVVAYERNGEPEVDLGLAFAKLLSLTFTADKLVEKIRDEERSESTYKLDPDKDPKEINGTVVKAVEAGRETRKVGSTFKGIYNFDGEKLTICINGDTDSEVPKEFKTKKGSGQILLELKKVKAAKDNEKAKDEEDHAEDIKKSQDNLKRLAKAMLTHHDTCGRFPPAANRGAGDKPLLSWRVMILPYLEQEALYKEFNMDQSWDSEHNKKLLAKMPDIYAPLNGVKTKEKFTTFYQVFTGQGTPFENPKGNRIADITDGTSNTIMIIEAGEAVPWTKPADLEYDAKKELPKVGGIFKTGFNFALCDGTVRFSKKNFHEKTMRLLITCNDGDLVYPADLDK